MPLNRTEIRIEISPTKIETSVFFEGCVRDCFCKEFHERDAHRERERQVDLGEEMAVMV